MLSLPPTVRVFVAVAPLDMRGSFDAIAGAVRRLGLDPVDGHLYLFLNKRRRLAKALWFDGSGWCLLAKRLEIDVHVLEEIGDHLGLQLHLVDQFLAGHDGVELLFGLADLREHLVDAGLDGGDLGFIPRKGMIEEKLSSAAFALDIGQVSEVIETEFGYHLLQVSERKPGMPSEFDKCIDDVRDTLAEELRDDLVRRLRLQTPVKITVP